MSYFQNVFTSEFLGCLLLADRQYSLTFKCRPNSGRGEAYVTAWKEPTYNLSINDGDSNPRTNLVLSYAIDPECRAWSNVSVNVASGASSSSAVTAREIVANLNASADFSGRFTASISKFNSGADRILITKKETVLKFYVVNGRAEEALGFNARAGVDQLPSYFDRHTIANRFTYVDGQNALIKLSPTGSNVAALLVDAAVDYKGKTLGYSSGSTSADWQLLKGNSELFMFTKNTVDGSSRITESILYSAGSVAGDFAKKTTYTYTAAKTQPDQITEIPYILTGSDLVTP